MNDKELTHIDLFSGIGGFTLAAEWAGFRTIVFCEKEEFCQKVLKERFGAIAYTDNGRQSRNIREEISGGKNKAVPNSEFGSRNSGRSDIYRPTLIPEIRDFDGTKWRGTILLTGGFPCQPFSVAGQRRGKEDDRYLWPEMLRVISEARPRWILAENVPGIFRMALDTVLTDLEGEGYATGTFIIPACSLNAPHRRNRVWIVANSQTEGPSWSIVKGGSQKEIQRGVANIPGEPNCSSRHIRDARNTKGNTSNSLKGISEGKKSITRRSNSHAPDSDNFRIRCNKRGQGETESTRSSWDEDWYEVATRFCRVAHGVPDRIHRLKALGNAIVPQIAYEILKNIAWIENERNLP